MTKKKEGKLLHITYIRSTIGYSKKHKATIRALGLHRLHQTVIHTDSPALRGMLSKVDYLVRIEEQE
jgi:large subunit ribosomal protein L30